MDINDNGILDSLPWETELDCVVSVKPEGEDASEFIQGNGDDPKYCPIQAGPDGMKIENLFGCSLLSSLFDSKVP